MRPPALRRLALSLVVLAVACDEPSPTRPSSLAPAATTSSTSRPPSSFSLSGVVYEATAAGLRPLAGVPLDISVEFQSWPPQTTSDAQGRYRISGLSSENVKVRAEMQGYSQPCRAGIAITGDTTLDVFLVPNLALSTKGVPASMPVAPPTLSGTVFERTSRGVQPIAGANLTADFSAGFGWAPSATTVTDVAGRYLICGVTDVGFGLEVLASKDGYVNVAVPVSPRATSLLDIELVRQ